MKVFVAGAGGPIDRSRVPVGHRVAGGPEEGGLRNATSDVGSAARAGGFSDPRLPNAREGLG